MVNEIYKNDILSQKVLHIPAQSSILVTVLIPAQAYNLCKGILCQIQAQTQYTSTVHHTSIEYNI